MRKRSADIVNSADQRTVVPAGGTETAIRVADVLTTFLNGESWLGVSDISRRLRLSKAVVHRILSSLVARDILQVDTQTHMYRLGPAAVAIGARALQHQEMLAVAEPTMRRLWEETRETVGLAALIGLDRVCINQHVSPKEIRSEAEVGRRIPLLPGASGLAMLTFLPEPMLEQVLRSSAACGVRQPAPELMETIRSERVVAVRTGHLSGVGSIASPVFGAGRTVMGAISVSAPLSRLDELEMWDSCKTVVHSAAEEVSNRLASLVSQHSGERPAGAHNGRV
jgi:IclR family transcriptional regulator, acetate operon repressor